MPDQNFSGESPNEINSGKFSGPVEKPRSANKAFGGILDFALFFENRNPEMKKFAKEFKEIENMNSEFSIEALNKVIAPKIDQCLNEMHKKSGTKLKNKYANLFTIKFETWEEFYNKTLYAYTIAGFLYEKMNEFLRNENWEKLDDLLPYTYTLFKAFLWGTTALTFSKNFEFLKSVSNENKLTLYRGADFDDNSLKFYETSKIEYFSWNGVTSTSLDKTIAREFQNGSPTKTPVLITIEVDFTDLKPQDFNALYLEGISNHPREREVALPPGSIFELLEKSEGKSEVEIRLKLVTNAKVLAHKGQFMHGMLQTAMGEEDGLKIVCLREKELSKAIKHCKENQYFAKLEFSLCNFNEQSARLLEEVLPTMKNLKSFTLNSVVFEEERCFEQIIKCLRSLKITKLEISNSISHDRDVKSLIRDIKYFGLLENFKLSFQEDYEISEDLVRELYNQVSQNLNPQCVFEFILNNFDIVIKGLDINNFLRNIGDKVGQKLIIENQQENVFNLIGTKRQFGYRFLEDNSNQRKDKIPWTKETLSLSFEGCKSIYDQDIKTLGCDVILHFQSPTSLDLDFKDCWGITDKALQILSHDVIRQLPLLNSLNLCFDNCVNITDEGLKSLICESVQHLQSLTTLRLSFIGCEAITNQGLKHFSRLGKKIKSLYLSFESCTKITDEGLENLLDLRNIQFLTNLDLDFSLCSEITDKALKILSNKFLKNLNTLSLKFDCCSKITNEGLRILAYEGIRHLESLQNLCLSFENSGWWRNSISNEGVSTLIKSLNNIRALKALHLNFDNCYRINDQTLGSLGFPRELITLHLSFNKCSRIKRGMLQGAFRVDNWDSMSDTCLEFICSRGIKHLQKLEKLHLDFSLDWKREGNENKGFTDEGLKRLGSDGIRHLPELRALYLDLDGHHQITHKGLKDLCSHLKKNKLTDFHLSLYGVTDQGLEALNFQEISLDSLSLFLNDSPQLSDEGLKRFWSEGIRQQRKLKNLSLRFDHCEKITDEGLKGICQQGIRHLASLASFDLKFLHCENITEGQILSLQYQINSLKLPRLQLPLNVILKEDNLGISSQCYRHTASLWCQDRLEFYTNKIESQQNLVENLNLKLEEAYDITDLDISSKLVELRTFNSLKTLHLKFDGCVKITDFALHTLCFQNLQHLESLTSLYLSFDGCNQITDRGLKILGNTGIKQLKSLVNLSLNFDGCQRFTDKGIINLCNRGIIPIKSLKILRLNFALCDKITNKSIKRLYHRGMKNITSFSLDFAHVKITERLKRQLFHSSSSSSILISQNNLDSTIKTSRLQRQTVERRHQDLQVSDEGKIVQNTMFTRYMGKKHYELHASDGEFGDKYLLKIPKKDIIAQLLLSYHLNLRKPKNLGLTYLHSLISLHLSLDGWKKFITDSVLTTISVEAFQHLKLLTTLSLNFHGCDGITDAGLQSLATQGIRPLKSSLTTLNLDFGKCTEITDVGLQSLWADGILYLELLTTLGLSFECCNNLTGDCFKNGTNGILSLTSLTLNFESCFHLKDENFKSLCMELIQNSIKVLHLNFNRCSQITDSGFKYFQQKSFSKLSLSFDYCWQIKGLQSLSPIDTTALNLSFNHCENIGLHLRFSNSLIILDLSFQGCSNAVTDQLLKDLCEAGLRHLVSLDALNLCFDSCSKITDEGVQTLSGAIRFMKALTTLCLSFGKCDSLTDKSLLSLWNNGIKHLELIKNVSLRFLCQKISYTALSSLESQIKLLTLPNLQHQEINNSAQSKTPLEKCRQSMLWDFPDQVITQHYNWKPVNISQYYVPQKNEAENLEKSEAILILFNYSQKFISSITWPRSDGSSWFSRSLSQFNFNFEISGKITNDNLKNLCSEKVQDFMDFTKLRLNFKDQMRKEGKFESFNFQEIGNLKKLKALHLTIDSCHDFTDGELSYLAEDGIKGLEQLNTLYLNFSGCNRITDEGLASLCIDGIQNIKGLKTLYLNFDGCHQITDEALKSVSLKGILNLSSIENLELSFLNCPKIPPSSFQAFLKILTYFGYMRVDQSSKGSKRFKRQGFGGNVEMI